jgi:predicted small metal-binding protein
MTTLTCDLCDHAETAASFDEWMEKLKPHYQKAHSDFMQTMMQKSPEEQKAEYMKWIKENQARFNAA